MRRFIVAWKKFTYDKLFEAHIVNYADDFVICCRHSVAQAMAAMREIMRKLKLTVNETKTRHCRVPDETFNFLGYTIGCRYSSRTGRAFLSTWPAAKKVQGICATLSELTRRSTIGQTVGEVVQRLNRRIQGWANYFCLGSVGAAYRAVTIHARGRLRQWLGRKNGKRVWASRCPEKHLHATLGLIDLARVREVHSSRVRTCGS